jgi:tRNA A-37 threonylcarbamoyl transferase component Bud32
MIAPHDVAGRGSKRESRMIGQTLKNYGIEAKLGQGGMGVVYRARDSKLERNVAIKVLPPELVRDPERRRRFVQEARAASAVNHPAIASIYEIEDEGENTFIVMEYVDGSTVRELVERGELDLGSAIEIGIQVADGLARAHEAGVVHRDIKSDNIMVTRDGHPKILDFGLAKLLDAEDGTAAGVSRLETVALTQAGMVVGTVAYMSPEQARGLPADKRSDVFSFGIVLYEMATGRLPFQGQSALDTMHAIAFDATQPLRTIRADLPLSLQRVVDRCLRKKPEDRYADLREAVADLRAVRRELDSGVSGRTPILERLRLDRFRLEALRAAAGGMSVPGLMLVGGVVLISLIILIPTLPRGKLGGLIPVAILGGIAWAHIRQRPRQMVGRFTRRAAKLKEVRLVAFRDGAFTVLADHPTAKTYVKLNALLESANNGLYQGAPMTLSVRENAGDAEVREIAATSGVRYLRDG